MSAAPTHDEAMFDALVVGGSGAVGRFLLRRLAGRGARVLALSRRAPPAWSRDFSGLSWWRGGLPDSDLASLPAARRIYSAGPLDAFAEACARGLSPAVEGVVALSSLSIVWKATARHPAERALAARLLRAEQTLQSALAQRATPGVLLRAGLLYGAGIDRSLTPLRSAAQRWRRLPWPGCARGARAPVHVDDVAAAMLAASEWPAAFAVLALPGVEALPFDALLDRLLATASPAPRRLSLPCPRWLPALLSQVPGRVGRLASVIDRAAVDQTADSCAWRSLRIEPRGFTPRPEDFRAWPE